MKKFLIFCLTVLLAVPPLPIGAAAAGDGGGVRWQDYNGKRIGVLSGSNFPEIVKKYLPDAETLYFNMTADAVAALKNGRVDAVAIDAPAARNIRAEDGSLAVFPELLGPTDYASRRARANPGKPFAAS